MPGNNSPSASEIISKINESDWLQGHVVPFGELVIHDTMAADIVEMPWPEFAVLISHSCSIHNNNLEKVPFIEWIGANKIPPDSVKNECLEAHNPRILHIPTKDGSHFELKIHQRVWTRRKTLFYLEHQGDSLLGDAARRQISYWVSHSYNRIATPDALDAKLKYREGKKTVGLGVEIDKFIKAMGEKIHSAWISVDPWDESPSDDKTLKYRVGFTFLAKNARDLQSLQSGLNDALSKAPNPLIGIDLDHQPQIRPLQDFTALDMENYERYNTFDWLSLEEIEDPE